MIQRAFTVTIWYIAILTQASYNLETNNYVVKNRKFYSQIFSNYFQNTFYKFTMIGKFIRNSNYTRIKIIAERNIKMNLSSLFFRFNILYLN